MQNNLVQSLTDSMTPKFAVSYLRVSTPGQASRGGGDDEGFSIPAQRIANKNKALSIGAIVGKEFVDRGTSARSVDRPELQKMLEYIKENAERVDYLIVHKVDRLARNRGDDVDIMRALAEAGVQLVSASESIDSTPSGMLLHGIMSSIAEFYSRNLSTEVKKGLNMKVEKGGTPSKAPLGYRNIRDYDDMGRRSSRVEIDTERAPLIKQAFQEYATSNWSLSLLAEHMTDLGLMTVATRKLPARPMDKKMIHNIFNNPYYKGIVTYNGVEYSGKHEPIIDEATWDKVQEILRSHTNGERLRKHDHYLKSTVFCGKCGSRLMITNAKSKTGARYPYFICTARHSKRNDCTQRALLIDDIEKTIEDFYNKVSFSKSFRKIIEPWFATQISELEKETSAKVERLKQQQDKLEREQRKLIQAHYADAIPLQLLKEEQERIGKSLKSITSQMKAYQADYNETADRLSDLFELIEDCGKTYQIASDYERRCFNQALFNKILVHENLSIEVGYTEPFSALLDPNIFILKREYEKSVQAQKDGQPKSAAHLSLMNLISTTQAQVKIFFTAGLSKVFLVHFGQLRHRICKRWTTSLEHEY